ncbi:hypothetical protein POM88_007985 [Heracleum sosnowskyi]|uniref:Uncharacterized protein n=1 Tax=Heracleum sosnowskyi TaxID=360622 RepID=A0AAD8J5K5_9APIA|nr:hypothetical protein POM88_007985 [Heracleum sosnowskyi]
MLRTSKLKPDFSHQNPLYQIKQDGKFFTKLVSKETSIANPSFRGVSVAVPFNWETQPGTPKHKLFSDHSSLPPTLTPPPSYSYFQNPTCSSKKHSKAKLLNILFLRMMRLMKGTTHITMSPASPSSSSSSLSSSSIPSEGKSKRRRLLSMGSVFDDDFRVPFSRSFSKSLLCFKS